MENKQTVLIVGASRGLGLALVEEYCKRGFDVIATVRQQTAALQGLQKQYPDSLEVHEQVDIVNLDSVRILHDRLKGRKLDVLFVNAGISRANELTPLQVEEQDYIDMMLTNALSPMRVVELFHENVLTNGVIALMSSELGSITNASAFWELYSSSKAALNMLAKSFAARHSNDSRAMLLIAPGWVRTDMGTQDAILDVSESIPLVVDVVTQHAGRPGLRYVDRFGKTIAW
ncbi:SDR family NAD(P)-dependent oxidoreductase [Mucilaginibacter limnophilus]|uniref:SDR family NAD(P)-dependent oxidoreductase n=1 Tax=Mucilaginibacter limnophilus TaxID=1932778 RepID=A0A3S2URU5_9SPHI|nr:SDR family NAD(P)-dependent oxidoreductase [Mucilaginibacter limnophilus]RVU03137.1 SDR family NAD(P)-dependent oxidoreductase [Mucilaginibacter limnophilus]